MIRTIDLLSAFLGLLLLWPIMIIVVFIGFIDSGSPIFVQTRVGRNKVPFKLIKFRTMPLDTESVASHLVNGKSINKFGSLLRKTKIDELPQLINVIKGDMSLVGPRPNLFNQSDVIKERSVHGVYAVLPGITGLSQIQNIDMSSPVILAKTDKEMIDSMSLKNYFKYIFKTLKGSGLGDTIN
ncbi:lipid carrier--UDP-N-acetylgalactosaminyltransferase [Vibrio breoganii]|uniref:sugar transferase n=1 Tax=Vibrio breoganii TaxID=553239 RepID=UPI000C83D673|nr:sugar transferase [Vibrio breoganii]PMG34495.1 lipid carrier--UDP-N-acetylgalactosaminyltransferase [Vibrio breoganii]PMK26358.1 lipid carrier--UDP-N-acetylgalactosaminyltransferase [Vibrio breoganii]PML57102.1 lipid carrier--UDP-N-acetylgalactosaminyltransferase [Vibrio breoganii]PMO80945.1 lipid carrier--UDP-N-acetylgalactosaminyltransferase [Vibrio breoganii]PMP05079.1 lipid carrier--UDP-N-acetylgalactosaminyltransferase [Vibrio breoganii]